MPINGEVDAEWRRKAKKQRRKRIRQAAARQRQEEELEEDQQKSKSPTYQKWLEEQAQAEAFKEQEEARLKVEAEALYLLREEQAQLQWAELQEKLSAVRLEREKQIAKIKDEWNREQQRLKDVKERNERLEREKLEAQLRLQAKIDDYVNDVSGDMPEELNVLLESNPGKTECPFFKKTATCRFNDACSRNHIRPTISRVMVIRNFFSHYSLEQTKENEHGSDSMLEFETHEVYKVFKEFFADVLPEMQKFGEVRQLKVCCNREAHLRGNVYVEYSSIREAIKSYRAIQGRWYGGKQLNVEFCGINSWRSAICGLFFQQRCPKGSVCNFLHVFKNPDRMFSMADRDLHRTPPLDRSQRFGNDQEWRWSESPEHISSRKDEPSERRERQNADRLRSRSRKRARTDKKEHKDSRKDRNIKERSSTRSARSSDRKRRKSKERSKRRNI